MLTSKARDLIDVVWLVHGFHFAVDVQNTASLGVRGENIGCLAEIPGHRPGH